MLVAAAKGRIAVFDRETCGCIGGGAGLGFDNAYTYNDIKLHKQLEYLLISAPAVLV